jgi:signal transduction histidine kinase
MYGRNPRRYLRWTLLAVLGPVVAALSTAWLLAARFWGIALDEFVLTLAALDASCVIAIAWALFALRRRLRIIAAAPVSAGPPSSGQPSRGDVMTESIGLPRRLTVVCMLHVVPISGLLAAALLAGFADDWTWSALDVAQFVLGLAATIAWGGWAAFLYLDLTQQPVRAALRCREAAGTAEPTSVAARFVGYIGCLALVCGAVVGTGIVDAESSDGILRACLLASAITLLVMPLSILPLTLTVAHPIRRLIAGTRAVGAGNLEVEVPVTSSDELGELAGSFNQMVEDLKIAAGELRDSRARVVTSADAARRRVERDLHDGAQQSLVLLNLKLGLAERLAGDNPAEVPALLVEARADLAKALDELRDLAHGIYPAVLTNDGLPAALAEAVELAAIPAEFEADGAGRYPPEIEAAVFFCCLEALQNAAKHAGEAARVTVRLAEHDGELRFQVSDDGAGFDAGSANGSAGLQNMTDRIGALGGELRIESRPGAGTTVAGSVPLAR